MNIFTRKYIVVKVNFWKGKTSWLAECAELETNAYADTAKKVLSLMVHLLQSKVTALYEEGILETYLSKRDIKIQIGTFIKPTPKVIEKIVSEKENKGVAQVRLESLAA